jgi:mRNA interferase RelE/StbE
LSEGGRRVIITPAAQRQLRRLPPGDAARLRAPILALVIDDHPSGAAKLAGTDFWRLRVGDLRIVYLVEGDGTVAVLRVARRSERTYRRVDRG